jgi:predicted SnoaL-like aldol condensation-catalyzing enzyme
MESTWQKGSSMKTTEENNKKLVLEAFDTLFNKRDYAAAERYWSPHYIQQQSYLAWPRGPVQSHQKQSAHAEV